MKAASQTSILILCVAALAHCGPRVPPAGTGQVKGSVDGIGMEVADVCHVFDFPIMPEWPQDLFASFRERVRVTMSNVPLDTTYPIEGEQTQLDIVIAMVRDDWEEAGPYYPSKPDEPRLVPGRYDQELGSGLGGVPTVPPDADHVHWPWLSRGTDSWELTGWTDLTVVVREEDKLVGSFQVSWSDSKSGETDVPPDTLVGEFSSRPCD